MRTPRFLCRFAALGALVAFAPGPLEASDWVVGPVGSGADHAEIQAAIDGAAAGDTIFVTPGQYARFRLTKPLRLIGEGSDLVSVTEPDVTLCGQGWMAGEVRDIPAGTQALVSGLTFGGAHPGALLASCFALRVHENDGVVVLNDIAISSPLAGLDVYDSTFVLLSSSALASVYPAGQSTSGLWAQGAGVRVVDSNVWIADSTIVGLGATPLQEPVFGHAGLKIVNSSVFLARSSVRGGDGGRVPFGACGYAGYPGAPGILVAGASFLRIAGTGADSIVAGSGGAAGACTGAGASAILVTGSSVVYRPDSFDLVSSSTGGVVLPETTISSGGSDVLSSVALPSLSAESGVASLTLKLAGVAGSEATLFASLGASAPLSFPGIDGSGALDPTSVLLIWPTTLDGQGDRTLNVSVPISPALQGLEIYFQWMQRQPGTSARGLSNPATVLIGS